MKYDPSARTFTFESTGRVIENTDGAVGITPDGVIFFIHDLPGIELVPTDLTVEEAMELAPDQILCWASFFTSIKYDPRP